MLKGIPTEDHERIGHIERRHAIVRSEYDKLKGDLPKISPSDRLSLTFRAINDVPDSDTGICSTTMVLEFILSFLVVVIEDKWSRGQE